MAVSWLFVVFDGYDLIVYGTVQKNLLTEWHLGPSQGGTLGSTAFVGMMVGAVVAGRLADAIGAKRTIIGSAAVLSVFTVLCALAGGPVAFGAFRFLAGLGLGGLVPSANAMAASIVPPRWRGAMATLMMSGVPIGGTIAALVGLGVIPRWGWRPMFAFALVALVVLVPVAVRALPRFVPGEAATVGRRAERPGFGALLRAPYLGLSVLFALATVVTLTAWYGLGTRLPNLMQDSGYDLGSALRFTLALNLGAVVGSVLTAWAGDRFGTVRVSVVAAAVAGAALLLLLTGPSVGVVYAVCVLAGVGTHGTQCLIIAAVTTYYPDRLRGTALGWALGVGRIGAVAAPQVGGWLVAWGFGVSSNFLLYGLCAVAAAVLLVAILARYGTAGVHADAARPEPESARTPVAVG